jgi:uncharacterized membrane protein
MLSNNMNRDLKTILIISILVIFIDSFYLKTVSNYFNKQVINVQGTDLKLSLSPAIICYIFLIVGLYYFIIKDNKPILDAFLLGLVIYMVFELTNKAIFDNWSWKTVALDGIWGGVLFAITTFITYKLI